VIEPIDVRSTTEIVLIYKPLLPADDLDRVVPFDDDAYRRKYDEPFEDVVAELSTLSVALLRLLPDPSLSPDERLERLARVVPHSQMVSAHRRTARAKLRDLRTRLAELVPDAGLSSAERLQHLIDTVDALVPGDARLIQKLERIGDNRTTDTGLAPWRWQ